MIVTQGGGLFDPPAVKKKVERKPRTGPRLLTGQILRVYNALKQSGGEWLSIPEIQNLTGDSGNSISAQIRNLRKAEFSSFDVRGRHRSASGGLWEYKLFEDEPQGAI